VCVCECVCVCVCVRVRVYITSTAEKTSMSPEYTPTQCGGTVKCGCPLLTIQIFAISEENINFFCLFLIYASAGPIMERACMLWVSLIQCWSLKYVHLKCPQLYTHAMCKAFIMDDLQRRQ